MARIVTGSVALRVAPTLMASTKVMSSPSSGMRVHSHSITPNTNAEMKVPANAKVRIVPMLRKKLAFEVRSAVELDCDIYVTYLMQLISTGQNNWRKKQVEKELIVEANSIQHTCDHSQAQDQAHHHSRED